ncbi:MAG TPA: hypothetical protein VNB94_08095 [Mycobacteriales bacterium]|nr:hypothetical protein [Mycobacteriales bacterium]
MKIRAAVLTGTIVLATLATSSHAEAPCNIIKDDKGDAEVLTSSDDAMDIVSADLAANGKEVAAVIRVVKLKKTTDQSPFGIALTMLWTAPGFDKPLFMRGTTTVGGADTLKYGYQDGNRLISLGDAIGTFDLDKSELRISTFTKNFAAQAKLASADKLTAVTAEGAAIYGSPAAATLSLAADSAAAKAPVVVGTESCILK